MSAAATGPVRLLQEALRHLQAGRTAEGQELCRRVLRLQPGNPDAFHLLGLNMLRAGRPREAAEQIERAIAINRRFAPFHNSLGTAWAEAGDLERAAGAFARAIELQPNYPEALSNLGSVFKNLRRYDEAAQLHRRAIALKPDYPDAHNNLGHVLLRQENAADASNAYREAVRLRPENASYHNNLAAALIEDDQLESAITECNSALKLRSNYADAYANLGRALADGGRYGDALSAYRTAQRLQPGHADAVFGEGQTLLMHGDYAMGWPKYEARWSVSFLREAPRHDEIPAWDGTSLNGRRILVWDEQGVGDKIMFAKAVPKLLQQDDCVVEVEPRLVPMFARSFPSAEVVATWNQSGRQDSRVNCDVQTSLGSLCRWVLQDPATFKYHGGYLRPDQTLVDQLRAEYRQLHGERVLVGVSWRGGTGKNQRLRSIPLSGLAPMLAMPECSFFSLQYGDCRSEIGRVRDTTGISVHIDESVNALTDLDRFAAQVAAMDLVVTIDNSTAHLAGALGVPVWVLLPVVPEWRWRLGSSDSPWYPSARLFRQRNRGDWSAVIGDVAESLRLFDPKKALPATGG